MTIHAAGTPLTFTQIAAEGGDTTPFKMSDYGRGGLYMTNGLTPNASIPAIPIVAGSAIKFSHLYGAQNGFAVGSSGSPANIGAQTDFNLRTWLIAQGWDTVKPVIAHVNCNALIKASSTGSYAFTLNGAFPAGSVLNITNQAGNYIVGKGGAGGTGRKTANGGGASSATGGNGFSAGAAMFIASGTGASINITNSGVIGGGGGGAAGGGANEVADDPPSYGGGGGGGAGTGAGGAIELAGTVGTAGTDTAGGAGGAGSGPDCGNGGTGGSLGSNGGAATAYGGLVGAGGAATSGAGNATWLATGTRYGSVG